MDEIIDVEIESSHLRMIGACLMLFASVLMLILALKIPPTIFPIIERIVERLRWLLIFNVLFSFCLLFIDKAALTIAFSVMVLVISFWLIWNYSDLFYPTYLYCSLLAIIGALTGVIAGILKLERG